MKIRELDWVSFCNDFTGEDAATTALASRQLELGVPLQLLLNGELSAVSGQSWGREPPCKKKSRTRCQRGRELSSIGIGELEEGKEKDNYLLIYFFSSCLALARLVHKAPGVGTRPDEVRSQESSSPGSPRRLQRQTVHYRPRSSVSGGLQRQLRFLLRLLGLSPRGLRRGTGKERHSAAARCPGASAGSRVGGASRALRAPPSGRGGGACRELPSSNMAAREAGSFHWLPWFRGRAVWFRSNCALAAALSAPAPAAAGTHGLGRPGLSPRVRLGLGRGTHPRHSRGGPPRLFHSLAATGLPKSWDRVGSSLGPSPRPLRRSAPLPLCPLRRGLPLRLPAPAQTAERRATRLPSFPTRAPLTPASSSWPCPSPGPARGTDFHPAPPASEGARAPSDHPSSPCPSLSAPSPHSLVAPRSPRPSGAMDAPRPRT